MLKLLKKLFSQSTKEEVSGDVQVPDVAQTHGHVDIFICRFDTVSGFESYAHEHWSDATSESFCKFAQDLGLNFLDHDFVETFTSQQLAPDGLVGYLSAFIHSAEDHNHIAYSIGGADEQYILLFSGAISRKDFIPHSTEQAKYIGRFDVDFARGLV